MEKYYIENRVVNRDTGIDWTGDCIGNTGAFMDGIVHTEDGKYYVTDAETLEWWNSFLEGVQESHEIDAKAKDAIWKYACDHDDGTRENEKNKVAEMIEREYFRHYDGCEYGDEMTAAQDGMDYLRDEYGITIAALEL